MRFRHQQDDARTATRRLLALFVLMLLGLVLAINGALYALWWLLLSWTGGLPAYFFETNTLVVLLFVLGGCWVETDRLRRGGGVRVAHWAGGREVVEPRDAQERRLLNVVDEMTIASGLPHPRVFVLDREDAINAFASGWTPDDAVIALTRGALERLTRDELQGLVAHEFGHIHQDDLRLNMVLLALVWGLSLVYGYGLSLMEADERGRRAPVGLLVGAAFVVGGSLGWLAGQMLQAAVSRQRELLADACAVQFTRSREGLGGTLRKVWFQLDRHEQLRHVPVHMMAAMLLQAPAGWMATHPPLSERLRRIYGRVVGPLASDVVPLAADAEPRRAGAAVSSSSIAPEGMLAAAPLGAMAPAPSGRASDAEGRGAMPRVAVNTTVPAPRPVLDADERDAIGRLGRLHGPGELRAAVLALLLTPGSVRERRAWRDETQGVSQAEVLLADVQRLSDASRLPWLERLLDRVGQSPVAERKALVESARRMMTGDGQVRPIDRLQWLAVRRRLAPAPASPVTPHAGQGLADLPPHTRAEIARLTAFVSRIVPDGHARTEAARGDDWFLAVAAAWGGEAGPCTPPDADGMAHALSEVQALPWMLRPVLVRAWLEAALALSPLGRLESDAADALRLLCFLIDSPVPPELARHYIEPPPA